MIDEDFDGVPEPPPEDIEMAVEEALGHPLPGNPAERIAAMKKRITYLVDQRRGVIEACEEDPEADYDSLLQRNAAELAEARHQLQEWQLQEKGRN